MLLADEARDYEDILICEELAQQWLAMAARASREQSGDAPRIAPSRRLRFPWRHLRARFR
jgi:hypothetical protein